MKVISFLFFSCLTHFSFSQSFNGPESIERNYPDGDYFIANNSGNEILKMTSSGTLSVFASGFASGGPHGLEVIGDTLYACAGSSLKLLNRNTGALINTIAMGATFLNGITHKNHMLYITDFSGNKIYRFNTKNNQFNVFVTGLTKSPNGIIYDYLNDRAVFVSWGTSATIRELNLYDSTTTLLTTTSYSNIDGIAMNCLGEFYTANWPSSIRKWPADFSSNTLVSAGTVSNPADIFFDAQRDTLLIPNSGNNTVNRVLAASCLLSAEEKGIESISLFPNPVEHLLNGYVPLQSTISFYTSDGKMVYATDVSENFQLDLTSLKAGIYLVKIIDDQRTVITKLIKQ